MLSFFGRAKVQVGRFIESAFLVPFASWPLLEPNGVRWAQVQQATDRGMKSIVAGIIRAQRAQRA